ncbi:MAG: hypothetical protein M3P27_13590 [Acidobacteriota bacterium]|nr:hypothetical protein [Acidobacteriota bacterium]
MSSKPDKKPNPIFAIYAAIVSPFLRLMDKMSGRDVGFERKSKKAA